MSFYVRGGYSTFASQCDTMSDAYKLAEKMSIIIHDREIVYPFRDKPMDIVLPIEILNEIEWKNASRC